MPIVFICIKIGLSNIASIKKILSNSCLIVNIKILIKFTLKT